MQRGTSKKEDQLDTVIKLRRPDEADPTLGATFELSFTKSRHFHGIDAKGFQVTLGMDEIGQAVWREMTLRSGSTLALLNCFAQASARKRSLRGSHWTRGQSHAK